MSETHQQAVAPSADPGPIGQVSRPTFKRSLTFFGFFAITASMVMTVYEYPTFASSGFHLVFFLIAGGILWFLPVALCAAEMATVKGWETGGIFAWVGNTLGRRWGFAALFFQWFQITVGFVTMSFFILAALAYVFRWDALYENPLVMFFGVAAIVWVLTLTQLGGTKYTARISKVGFVGGIIVPVLVLLAGLIAYFATGGVSQINIAPTTLVPDFTQTGTLVIFASFILAYMGVEASASHVNELKNPNRNYPLAMIILAVLTIALDAIGGLAVATTLPASVLDGNLSFGVIEAFRSIFVTHFGADFGWIVFVVAVLLALGVLAEISAWIVGPSRALLDTAHDGILPPSFKKVNKNGVSVKTVVIQAIIVTAWDAVLCGSIALSGGSSSSVGYLTAIGLTVVIYLVGYVLFFIGYFALIFKKKNLQRTFQLPGGTPFKAIVAGAGLFMTVATLIISFFPSSNLDAQSNMVYQVTLGVAFVISVAIPFVIFGMRHRWAPKQAAAVSAGAGTGAHAGAAASAGRVGAGPSASAAVSTGSTASDPGSPVARSAASATDGGSSADAGTPLASEGAGKVNKRTRAKDSLNNPHPAGASGSVASGGLGGRVAHGISAAVVSVTSRPAGPIPVDAKETVTTIEAVRMPGSDDATGKAEAVHSDAGGSDAPGASNAGVPASAAGGVPPACKAPFAADERQSAAGVRDDLLDRTAAGDPDLRASVTEGVVGAGMPEADPDTPDPQRETGPDTNGSDGTAGR